MKKFTIRAEWIKEVITGYNDNWHYHYKEYIFNDSYTEAYSLRIPQGAIGIQAMLFSNGSGIRDEYSVVELINGDKAEIIFNMDKVVEGLLRVKNEQLKQRVQFLEEQLTRAQTKLDMIAGIVG